MEYADTLKMKNLDIYKPMNGGYERNLLAAVLFYKSNKRKGKIIKWQENTISSVAHENCEFL